MGSKVLSRKGFQLHHHPSKFKKHSTIVVFIHHMWGNHKTTSRHYRVLNEWGFDCVSFDLIMGSNLTRFQYHPFLKYFYKGIFYIWKLQIESALNEIPGPKILFAFSGPSLSALWASHKRRDVARVVCDGGPFHDIYANTRNFFRIEVGFKNPFLNAFAAFWGSVIWGYKPLKKLHQILDDWPLDRPILSIRGCKDQIVRLSSIAAVFAPHPGLPLQVIELPEGDHLDGLKNYPDLYTEKLQAFLLGQS